MSAKNIIAALVIIFSVNLIAVVSFEIDENNNDKDSALSDNAIENTIPNEKVNTEQDAADDKQDSTDPDSEDGNISTGGAFIDKVKADSTTNYKAIEKSESNQTKILTTGRWIATNYAPGDITSDTWIVQRGDTLWEIAEAKYGTGRKWTKIRDLNYAMIRKDKNGIKSLIISGQLLKV